MAIDCRVLFIACSKLSFPEAHNFVLSGLIRTKVILFRINTNKINQHLKNELNGKLSRDSRIGPIETRNVFYQYLAIRGTLFSK